MNDIERGSITFPSQTKQFFYPPLPPLLLSVLSYSHSTLSPPPVLLPTFTPLPLLPSPFPNPIQQFPRNTYCLFQISFRIFNFFFFCIDFLFIPIEFYPWRMFYYFFFMFNLSPVFVMCVSWVPLHAN